MRESKASKEQIDQRRKAMDEYRLWRENVEQEFMAEKEERLAFRNGIDTDELDSHVENFEEETIEFLIKVEETILDNE